MPTSIKSSTLKNLISEFDKQRDQFRILINRLASAGHRLSNTDYPKIENEERKDPEVLPFNDGDLMTLYYSLKENQDLLNNLLEHVNKLDELF